MKIQQNAFILHRYPYRNNSYITDFFTQDHGIISAVCKGVRNNPKQWGNICFVPLWIEYSQRSQLASLSKCEAQASGIILSGSQLYCGIYLNELLLKLLPKYDSYPVVFACYQQTLAQLSNNFEIEPILRNFELTLLKEIGYAIQFTIAANTQLPIEAQKIYEYRADSGFNEIIAKDKPVLNIFTGKIIMEIATLQFASLESLRVAKYILRTAIDDVLGNRVLNSRQLFINKEYTDA